VSCLPQWLRRQKTSSLFAPLRGVPGGGMELGLSLVWPRGAGPGPAREQCCSLCTAPPQPAPHATTCFLRMGAATAAGPRRARTRRPCPEARSKREMAPRLRNVWEEATAAAPAPMYPSVRGWHVLWKRLPGPAPSPPSRRDAKHTLTAGR